MGCHLAFKGVQVQIWTEFWRLRGLILEALRDPWGDILRTLGCLCALFCIHVCKRFFKTLLEWIWEASGPQKQANRLRRVAILRNSTCSKKCRKIIDFGTQFGCVLEVLGLTWATLGATLALAFVHLHPYTIFAEIWCPRASS